MKNFSDLLAIKPCINVGLRLHPITANGNPSCRVEINNKIMYQGSLYQDINISTSVTLQETISISVSLQDKNYHPILETAVVIQDLIIDDFNLVPDWTHLASYQNDHAVNNPTSYLGFNGTWQLLIDQPFYLWRHRVTGQGWLLTPYNIDCYAKDETIQIGNLAGRTL